MEKHYIITLDTGTTNTRTILWNEDRRQVAAASSPTGVRDTAIDGNDLRLKAAVRQCLENVLEQGGISYEQVRAIIASGMITSNVGLVEIPHLAAPAGIDELARGTVSILMEEICPLPIWFIPGIKNLDDGVTLDNFEAMDIMRGEEVESLPVIRHYGVGKQMLLVLPGSHTKFIRVDQDGRIAGCVTSITGELLSVITNNTIIADAVGHRFATEETYDQDMMLLGYRIAKTNGLGKGCFSARILNMFVTKDKEKLASYLLGAVLQSDMAAIRGSAELAVDSGSIAVVAGKNPLRRAIAALLDQERLFARVEEYEPDDGVPLSALGAYMVAQRRSIL